MPARHREKNKFLHSGGSVFRRHTVTGATTTTAGHTPTSIKVCDDWIGRYDQDNPLTIRSIRYNPVRVSGTGDSTFNYYEWNSLAITSPVSLNGSEHVTTGIPTQAYLITEALARANPYARPEVDTFNFLFELRDFPAMLRHLGDLWQAGRKADIAGILNGSRQTPIAIQFGWRPLINDLKTLFSVAQAVERKRQRLEEFGDDFTTKHIRLVDLEVSDKISKTFGFTTSTRIRNTRFLSWATIKHKLEVPPRMSLGQWEGEAVEAAFNLSPDFATLWSSIPWSWLIDYCANIGTFLESQRAGNLGRYKASSLCLMRQYQTVSRDVSVAPSGAIDWSVVIKGEGYRATAKTRSIHPNPTARLAFKPFLTQGQLGNLAALALAAPLKGRLGR